MYFGEHDVAMNLFMAVSSLSGRNALMMHSYWSGVLFFHS